MEATKDENAVLFEKSQQAGFERLRDTIRAEIGKPSVAACDGADELTKLADLVERGFLTREEFDARKAVLLRGCRPDGLDVELPAPAARGPWG